MTRSRGFVYAVGRMGVTGEQAVLADSARQVAERVTAVTRLPVCVGIGVSTPEQAVEVCQVADGVVVGSALVRRLLEGRRARRRRRVLSPRRAVDAARSGRRSLTPSRLRPPIASPAQDRSGRIRPGRSASDERSDGDPGSPARCLAAGARISSLRSWRSRKVIESVSSVNPMAAR